MCMQTHTHTLCWMGFLFSFFSTGSVKNRRGAFVLLKVHLIMLVAGSLPELVGFKRRKRKEKTVSNAQPSVTHFTHPTHWPTFSTIPL